MYGAFSLIFLRTQPGILSFGEQTTSFRTPSNLVPVLTSILYSSQIVASDLLVPLPDQTPHENLRLFITAQLPPLDPPVNSSTPGNPLNYQMTLENITHIDHGNYRAAWAILAPALLLSAERWSALSVFNNQTYYESREVYDGAAAGAVQLLYENALSLGFQAQADALKVRAEKA